MNTQLDPALINRLNPSPNRTDETPSNELGQEDFFELMLAQLKKQDPTKPQDGQQILGQLAQFSTVNGVEQLNQSFNQLASSLQSLNALQASSLVGRSVLIDAEAGYLGAEGSLEGRVNFDTNVNNLTLIITDTSGQEVRRMTLGDHASGSVDFSWDGTNSDGVRAAAGTYQVKIEGMVDGEVQSFDTQVRATVQSVSLGQGTQGKVLNLVGLGAMDLNLVQEIF